MIFGKFFSIFGNLFFEISGTLETLENKFKKFLQMSIWSYKIGLRNFLFTEKSMESKNFKHVYLRTMIFCLQA